MSVEALSYFVFPPSSNKNLNTECVELLLGLNLEILPVVILATHYKIQHFNKENFIKMWRFLLKEHWQQIVRTIFF